MKNLFYLVSTFEKNNPYEKVKTNTKHDDNCHSHEHHFL